jgi:hypothetical protein
LRLRFGYYAASWSQTMNRILLFSGLLALAGMTLPAAAQDAGQSAPPCYWCIADALYENVKLIAHEEANPDLDEGVKGPDIVAARADIHRLRRELGPLVQSGTEPCCYGRKPIYIR